MRYWIQRENILDSSMHTAEVDDETVAIYLCMLLNNNPVCNRHHIYDTATGEFVTPEIAKKRLTEQR